VAPCSQKADASLPVTPSDTLVPSSARMHRLEALPANWAVAEAEAVGAVVRNSLVNHIGCTCEITTVKCELLVVQVIATVLVPSVAVVVPPVVVGVDAAA